ncbi:hypothetical protein B0I35DRAFT_212823 [Stachybotrys elegans]|uniref:Secreted protein n=1 Tax=Stachybotrys elegans TaxID=80388 RepID=A0A8K0WU79_9HYPO|nr:hypothetical protein B0I35DRAFT_212823 [Stachybotrys elegans]
MMILIIIIIQVQLNYTALATLHKVACTHHLRQSSFTSLCLCLFTTTYTQDGKVRKRGIERDSKSLAHLLARHHLCHFFPGMLVIPPSDVRYNYTELCVREWNIHPSSGFGWLPAWVAAILCASYPSGISLHLQPVIPLHQTGRFAFLVCLAFPPNPPFLKAGPGLCLSVKQSVFAQKRERKPEKKET